MTTIIDPTHEDLNQLMEFGHLVQVWSGDGHTYLSDQHDRGHTWPSTQPEEAIAIYGEDPDDEQLKEAMPLGWDLVTGYTGQYGYRGPAMHDSEYIGGRLAEAILEHPGFYQTSYIDWYTTVDQLTEQQFHDDVEFSSEPHPEGWVVAYYGPDIV